MAMRIAMPVALTYRALFETTTSVTSVRLRHDGDATALVSVAMTYFALCEIDRTGHDRSDFDGAATQPCERAHRCDADRGAGRDRIAAIGLAYSVSSGGGTIAPGSSASRPAINTAWVRLLAPSLRRIAVTWALTVASDTPSS